MKKIVKTLTVAILALAAVFACAFAVSACGGEPQSDYNFTITTADGKALNGQTGGVDGGKVISQICLPGEGGLCIPLNPQDIYISANGTLHLSQEKVNELFESDTDVTVFILHVLHVPGQKDDCEVTANGKGNYELKLTAA